MGSLLYKQNGKPLDFEPYVYSAAPGFGTQFKGVQYQKAGTKTTNSYTTKYKVNGQYVQAVKNGYFPTFKNHIWGTTFAGEYRIGHEYGEYGWWQDGKYVEYYGEYLCINRPDNAVDTVYLRPEDFRGGIIPNELLIVIVGGGGGAAGCSYYSLEEKDVYDPLLGGAGGGAGAAVVRVNFELGASYKVTVGTNGKVGASGTSGGYSAGSDGSAGTSSYLKVNSTTLATANGGSGGRASPVYQGENGVTFEGGIGGSGGTASYSIYSAYSMSGATINGGDGNDVWNINKSSSSSATYYSIGEVGDPGKVIGGHSLDGATYNVNTWSSPSDLKTNYYAGGCSYGYGGKLETYGGSQHDTRPGDGGGGGSSAWPSSYSNFVNGGYGLVELFY